MVKKVNELKKDRENRKEKVEKRKMRKKSLILSFDREMARPGTVLYLAN